MMTPAVRRGMLAFGLIAGLAATPAFAAEKDPVVATINGSAIHLSEVAEFQRGLPPQLAQAPFQAILDVLITNRLVAEEADKEGLRKDPQVRREVRMAEDAAVRHAWMSKKLRSAISGEALRAQYDQLVSQFKPEDEVHALHILVPTEAEAQAVIADLNKGVDFKEEAKAKSQDPSAKKNGGDLGFFTKGEMVPAFADAAFAMKPGEISKTPVKSQFGWHVIKVVEIRKTTPPTFEQAKPMLRERMAEQIAQKLVTELRSKAKIKTFNPDGSPATEHPADAK